MPLFKKAQYPRHLGSNRKIRIVAGFSSVGKSTYIKQLMESISDEEHSQAVYEWMFRNGQRNRLVGGDVFHLDISAARQPVDPLNEPLVTDHPWAIKCFKQRRHVEVDMIIASEDVIRERILNRRTIGIGFGEDYADDIYPWEQKLTILNSFPLHLRYGIWFKHLEQSGIPFRIFNAENAQFNRISTVHEAIQMIKTPDNVKAL